MELEEHNNADDNFIENMINVLQAASNAHKTFKVSINEKKKEVDKIGSIETFTERPKARVYLTSAV